MAKVKKQRKKEPVRSSSSKFEGKLSLVIPCYNESERIPALIDSLKKFESKWKSKYEVIFVNDGSTDDTLQKLSNDITDQLTKASRVEIVDLKENQGKGSALQEGVTYADGDFILTLDADMAASPTDLNKWLSMLPGNTFSKEHILIGSREHEDAVIEGPGLRKVMGLVFNFIIQLFTPLTARDTQCGFKLYPKEIGKKLFKELKITGWAHDVEILYRAKLKGIPIIAMPVKWKHIEGTKIKVVKDSFQMAIQVFLISLLVKFDWFFGKPIADLKNKVSSTGESSIFRLLFAVTAVGLLVLMPLLSPDFGISGDEYTQHQYGERLVKYYESGGEDKAALEYKNLKYYGGLFDYLVTSINAKGDGTYRFDIYEFRHFVNSLFGFLMIFFAGLLAFHISDSWKVAFLTLLFLALSPRIFGHSMNNPKDIPFAAAVVFSILFIVRFIKELPKPGWGTTLFLALGIGACINIRVGGVLMIAYLLFFTLLAFLFRKDLRTKVFTASVLPIALGGVVMMTVVAAVFYYIMKSDVLPVTLSAILLVATFLGINNFMSNYKGSNKNVKSAVPAIKVYNYLLMIIAGAIASGTWFWPFAAMDPVNNMLETFGKMASFETAIRVLFSGEHVWSDKVPWNYIPNWMAITSPIFILVGALLFGLVWFAKRKSVNHLFLLLLVFATVFPVAYAIYKSSPLYDGMRHFLFVYPTLAIIAAFAWGKSTELFSNKMVGWGIGGLLTVLMAIPAFWMVKNHPYQYVYFNELYGGTKKAYAKYETDYWMNSMKGLCDWLVENDPKVKSGKGIRIGTNAIEPVKHYLRTLNPELGFVYSKYPSREKDDWDYGLFFSRFVNKDFMENGAWPPADVVYEEKAGGATIGAISQRKQKFGMLGEAAMKQRNYQEAIAQFNKELEIHPKNESALIGLAQANLNLKNFPEMKKSLDKVLALGGSYVSAVGLDGVYYLNIGDIGNAEARFKKALKLNYKYYLGDFYLANIYKQTNKLDLAAKHIEQGRLTAGRFKPMYILGAEIYNLKGDKVKAQQYQQAANSM